MPDLPSIAVVDDDREIRSLLTTYLGRHGFRVHGAKDGAELRKLVADRGLELIVLDLMMPGEDGLSLCRWLRQAHPSIPIIMLSALGDEPDRILGLELGADDYLAKPFNPRELVARIKAVLRRAPTPPAPADAVYGFGDFTLNPATRCLMRHGIEISLTAGEYGLLLALVERAGRVLSRDDLLELTRGRAAGPFDRAVDVQISRLRRKLDDDPAMPAIIKTVRAGGYVLAVPVNRP